MVFVKDFKKEFYDEIQHQRVLVLVSLDVDSLCACKILQYLFQCDHVLYTIVPVTGKQELERAYVENSEGVQFVILINCGATLDVVEALQPEDNVVFYICDSHRPVDVHNIYNQVQVRLLLREDDLENIPDFDDVFRDDDSDDGDSDDSETSEGGKKRRFDEAALEKRMHRRKWDEQRKRIIFEYTEFSGFGLSSSLLLYEMAWKMSKDTNDLLWLAILGTTEQFINQKVDRDKYIESVGQLQSHVSRLNHRPEDEAGARVSVDCLKVAFDQELRLTLYRHWSLYESLGHTEYTACKFRVWTMKGKKRLQEFLADMGLPLSQCKQKFSSMDVSFKDSVKDLVAKFVDKYNLSEQDLFFPSFHAQYGYKHRYCASDVVYACEAVLESVDKELDSSDNFLRSLDILNRARPECLLKALDMSRTQFSAVVTQVQSFLDMNQVIAAGPFLYAFIQEGSPDAKFFSQPICVARLAKFTLEAYCAMSKNKKAKMLPLVLGAHHSSELGTMLVIGIPPVLDKSLKNCFGKAFEQAASSTSSRTLHDQFDTHIIELKTEDRSKFFDALISLLQ